MKEHHQTPVRRISNFSTKSAIVTGSAETQGYGTVYKRSFIRVSPIHRPLFIERFEKLKAVTLGRS